MANEPTIEEILASLDRLLEDSTMAGNDDAGGSPDEKGLLPEWQDGDELPFGEDSGENKAEDDLSLAALFADGEDDVSMHAPSDSSSATVESDFAASRQDADGPDESGLKSDAEDEAPEFHDDVSPSVAMDAAEEAAESEDIEPLETDMAAAVYDFSQAAAPDMVQGTENEHAGTDEHAVENPADEQDFTAAGHDVDVLSETDADILSAARDESDMADQMDEGSSDTSESEDDAVVGGLTESNVSAEEEGLAAESGDEATDSPDPEEAFEESPPVIMLTAENAVQGDDDVSSMPDTGAQLPLAPGAADIPKPSAGVMLLTESMLVEDHQNELPFDRGSASGEGENVSGMPATGEDGVGETRIDDALPADLPESLQDLISERVARRIEEILPSLVEASVAKAMKKARKQAKRKIRPDRN
ncbi:MAG TPA: hypothetical protein VKA31_11520 [Mariprofundaceae bacterium]|nr:hypothetical protein [Mariprofundaceae bacterium]